MKNTINKQIMKKYNVLEFESLLDIFNWLYKDEYTAEELVELMKNDTMRELVEENDNVRIFDHKYYYSTEMHLLEKELEDTEEEL